MSGLPHFLIMEQIHEEATNEQTPPERLSQLAQINSTIASLVANNPNAAPELLTELADREEDFIRKNVAANPNTPMEVLWKLGEEFPEEVLDNAVLPLLLLENPNLLDEIPRKTMTSFLECSAMPISFLEWAIAVEWTQKFCWELARNSQTPHAILEVLTRSPNKALAVEVELMVNYAGELEEDWQGELRRFTNQINVFSGKQPDRWQDIANDYFFHVLVAMGLVPEFLFESLASHESIEFRCLVASIATLPLKLVKKLGRDSNYRVRALVAKNPNASADLLERLAKDRYWTVRLGVAENPNVSPKLLERLATDEKKEVRTAVAKNSKVPTYLLEKLADDEEARLGVAFNSNTPKALLEKLALNKLGQYQELKTMLAANPNTPVEFLEKWGREEPIPCKALARNPNTPKYLLEKFAESQRPFVRTALASNPKVPESIIHQLAKDENREVRQALATNPRTPLEVLLCFKHDVQRAAAANPKAPFSIVEKQLLWLLSLSMPRPRIGDAKILLRYLREKPEELPALLEAIVKLPSEKTRTIALMHPQMPPKFLAENGQSLDWLERCAIAQNPNTPTETLQLLAADSNRIVRAAAKENLKPYTGSLLDHFNKNLKDFRPWDAERRR